VIPLTFRRAAYAFVLALALTPIGCGNGRPPGIGDKPGDSFVELSDLQGEIKEDMLNMHVHYRFPDDLPHPDAWFTFFFEINGGKSGIVTVRKQGRDLLEEGDIESSTSVKFLRRKDITCAAQVQQAAKKEGPWHAVSEKLASD
jgi:hypothetical protein